MPDNKPKTDLAIHQPTSDIAIPEKREPVAIARSSVPARPAPPDSWLPRKDMVKKWAILKELNHYEVLELTESASDQAIEGRATVLEMRLDMWSDAQDAQLQEMGRQGRQQLAELRAAFRYREDYDARLAMKRRVLMMSELQQQAEEVVEKVLRGYHYQSLVARSRKRGMSDAEIETVMNHLRADGVGIEIEVATSKPVNEKEEPANPQTETASTVSITGDNLMTEKDQPPSVQSVPGVISNGMILIQGGTFMMGEGSIKNAKPVHKVTLSNFLIDRYLLVFTWYDRYCNANNLPLVDDGECKPCPYPYEMRRNLPFFESHQTDNPLVLSGDRPRNREDSHGGWGRGLRPVINVSWNDAIKFCNWKSRSQGLAVAYNEKTGELLDRTGRVTTDTPEVEGYRLPTEAEWEYAARGGQKSRGFIYSGSNDCDKVAWSTLNSGGKTHPVGKLLPNELGLYDMSGNVFELCQDWFNTYAGRAEKNPLHLSGEQMVVVRGGSWRSESRSCWSTFRYVADPNVSGASLGFRLARSCP
jgi:formylglycine-generating enzyme required for sulfatase activity